ncbi:MAG TPA: choice-of-anchor Q domain-containing protein [Polyangia bacterium]|nr:choice-of-anchor Q domain-containing protein [Polyangia bacterium]
MKRLALALLPFAALALTACSSSMSKGGDGGGSSGGGGGGGDVDFGVPPLAGDGGMVSYTCAHEIHVAPNGDDSAAGTADAPMKTIAKATPKAQPGDCVQVHAGTYAESTTITFMHDGTADMPIVLRSADGKGAAIVDAGGNRTGETLLVRNDYIVIDGFEFQNSPTDTSQQVVHFDGLNMNKCNGSVLRNCKITGGFDQIKINEAAPGVTVEFNELYGAFGHLPVSLTGAPGLVFRGNFGHDWNTGDNGAVQLKGGSHDVLFDSNRFQDITSNAGTIAMGDGCDSTCDIDPDHYAAVRVHAINNVMVRVGRGFDVQGCSSCDVLSNTIVDSGDGNVLVKITSAATNGTTRDSQNVRILDNVIASSTGNMGNVMQVNGASGTGLMSDYNLAFDAGKPVAWGDGHPASADTHSVMGDPKFTAPPAGDYTPGPGSAAIGAGTNLFSDVPHDALGNARPSTGPFDIGAYQSH